jgi:hypothetical protein
LVSAAQQTRFVEPMKPGPVTDYGGTIAPATPQSIDWLTELQGYPSILIHGPQGSGKSTAAEQLIAHRRALGHQIKIIDIHRAHGQWPGLDVIGDGMDFAAVDRAFSDFIAEVRQRYELRASTPDYSPPPLTVLVEEFTQMASHCVNSSEFFGVTVSDIRKIGMHVIYVSHARTMGAIGGAKGLAATRDASLLELELTAKRDETTGQAVPTGQGRIRSPGGQTVDISLPVPEKHRFHSFPEAEAEAEAEALYRRYKAGGYRSQKAAIGDLFGVFGGRKYSDCAERLERVKEQGDREGWK